jgi:hypothetical protein
LIHRCSHHRLHPSPPPLTPASPTASEEEDVDLRKKTRIQGLTAEEEDATPRLRSGELPPLWLLFVTGAQTALLLSWSASSSSHPRLLWLPIHHGDGNVPSLGRWACDDRHLPRCRVNPSPSSSMASLAGSIPLDHINVTGVVAPWPMVACLCEENTD